jgi:hypothetical protein
MTTGICRVCPYTYQTGTIRHTRPPTASCLRRSFLHYRHKRRTIPHAAQRSGWFSSDDHLHIATQVVCSSRGTHLISICHPAQRQGRAYPEWCKCASLIRFDPFGSSAKHEFCPRKYAFLLWRCHSPSNKFNNLSRSPIKPAEHSPGGYCGRSSGGKRHTRPERRLKPSCSGCYRLLA